MKTLALMFSGAVFAVLFAGVNPVLSKSWAEAIAEVEVTAEEYWRYGLLQGANSHIGTMYNEVDVLKHRCAILGRLLKQESLITHLEYLEVSERRSGMDEAELHALMVYSQSLRNWAGVARSVLGLDESERRNLWNVDCVGKQGIPSAAFLSVTMSRATFRQDGQDIIVLGDIEGEFSRQLEAWIEANPQSTRIVLGSGGGNVREAIRAGLIIRERRLETTLYANCYSACPLVFLGGTERIIWSPYPRLGFHQAYSASTGALPSSHEIYVLIQAYVEAMGANPSIFVAAMLSSPPSEMFEPDFEVLCAAGVATFVQRLCP